MTTDLSRIRTELVQVAAVSVAMIEQIDNGKADVKADCLDRPWLIGSDITSERYRQDMKWGPRNMPLEKWLAILMEEVGEVAEAIIEGAIDWQGVEVGNE